MVALSKKLSVKTLGWDKDAILTKVMTDKTKSHELAVIYGSMTKFKRGETVDQAGEVRTFTGLRGIFKGINLDTQENMSAAVAYLPEVALDVLEGSFEEGSKIDFAVKILAKYESKAATAYVFEAEFVTEISADPFAALEQQISNKVPALKQLAAPAKEEKKETAKKTKAA